MCADGAVVCAYLRDSFGRTFSGHACRDGGGLLRRTAYRMRRRGGNGTGDGSVVVFESVSLRGIYGGRTCFGICLSLRQADVLRELLCRQCRVRDAGMECRGAYPGAVRVFCGVGGVPCSAAVGACAGRFTSPCWKGKRRDRVQTVSGAEDDEAF